MIRKFFESLRLSPKEPLPPKHQPKFLPQIRLGVNDEGELYLHQTGLIPDAPTQEAYFELFQFAITHNGQVDEDQINETLTKYGIDLDTGWAAMKIINEDPRNQEAALAMLKARGLFKQDL